ncbi:MAG: type II secretion system protein [Deltaproteobacteria bacterium]|nr:type II secretion system protein [Deltaproteobacteria bacterium]
MSRRPRANAFTLIEVTIALAILAVSLAVLLEAQAASVANASRARALTIASVLARSKMIDIEQKLFDEGFTSGEDTDEGDFKEEGHEEYRWKYRVSELSIDLGGISSLCAGFTSDEAGQGDCESLLSGLGGSFDLFTDELEQSLRLVDLSVSWTDGKFTESMRVKALVTRDDYALAPPMQVR